MDYFFMADAKAMDLFQAKLQTEIADVKITALTEEAWDLRHQDPQQALALAEEAYLLAQHDINPLLLGLSLRTLGGCCLLNSQHPRAERVLTEALLIFKRIGERALQADCHHQLAAIRYHAGDYVEMLEHGLVCLRLREELSDRIGTARALTSLGLAHNALSDIETSLSYYIRALALYEEDGDLQPATACLNNLGKIYYSLEDYKKALGYHQRSAQVATQFALRGTLVHSLHSLALDLLALGRTPEAEAAGQRALQNAREMQSREHMAQALLTLAQVTADADPAGAAALYEEALAEAKAGQLRNMECEILLPRGQFFLAWEERSLMAVPALEQALALAEEIGFRPMVAEAHKALSEAWEKQGNYTQAFNHFRRFHEVSKEIVGQGAEMRARAMLIQLEDERQQTAEARKRADQDSLTGLLNHRTFHERLKTEVENEKQGHKSLAVAVLDTNYFQFFNDVYGHSVGDEVLIQIADALGGGMREGETVARYGGDEFALILPGVTMATKMATIARIEECLQGLYYCPPGQEAAIPLTLSLGLTVLPEEASDHLDALRLAGDRLRLAKSGAAPVEEDIQNRLRGILGETFGDFAMLYGLVTAVSNRDSYTLKHSEEVMTYTLEIAHQMRLSEAVQQRLLVAALLHDIGKIGVPDAVLRKPASLTDQEFEQVKLHPSLGAAIVGGVPGFRTTLPAIRHHHERWDGKGYPGGLAGTRIPLAGRIMAVADAYSALTTDRPYRKGMPVEKALSILQSGAGTQWDPACVRAFLRARQQAE
jgi:diguanylate cyclase (GGDEF)-like protein